MSDVINFREATGIKEAEPTEIKVNNAENILKFLGFVKGRAYLLEETVTRIDEAAKRELDEYGFDFSDFQLDPDGIERFFANLSCPTEKVWLELVYAHEEGNKTYKLFIRTDPMEIAKDVTGNGYCMKYDHVLRREADGTVYAFDDRKGSWHVEKPKSNVKFDVMGELGAAYHRATGGKPEGNRWPLIEANTDLVEFASALNDPEMKFELLPGSETELVVVPKNPLVGGFAVKDSKTVKEGVTLCQFIRDPSDPYNPEAKVVIRETGYTEHYRTMLPKIQTLAKMAAEAKRAVLMVPLSEECIARADDLGAFGNGEYWIKGAFGEKEKENLEGFLGETEKAFEKRQKQKKRNNF